MSRATDDYETISVESETEKLGRIVLDRPDEMNTMNMAMARELEAALEGFEADETTRGLVITGRGRAFSAGADVSDGMGDGEGAVTRQGTEMSRRGQRIFGRFRETEMPIVAAIDGFALGAGMELTMCADLRVASERSELGLPEHNLGLLPGWGGTGRLQQLVGESTAKYVIFTGDRFSAERMREWGFVHEIYDDESFESEAIEFAETVANGPPLAQRYTKRAIHAAARSLESGLEVEAQGLGSLLDTDDLAEGMEAFYGDGEPEFEGK